MRRLIINADDFGFTPGVNAGIVHAHVSGVLTSTTLMANGDAFDDAVRLAQANPTLDIGAHLVLVQGHSLLTGKPLPETPRQLLIVLAMRGLDVYAELKLQIEKIRAAGIRLSHLDTHKHTHLVPSVFRAVVALANEFSVPWVRLPPVPDRARLLSPRRCQAEREAARSLPRLSSDRHAHRNNLRQALQHVPEGTTEFMCHPGYLNAGLKGAATRLKESRVRELEALTSPRIKELIASQEIQLSPF